MANHYESTSSLYGQAMVEQIEKFIVMGEKTRKPFERRWYDNMFFDDGFHFRFVSKKTGQVIDLIRKRNIYSPMRAIPIASTQIRGVANLLLATKMIPVIYPERVLPTNYKTPKEVKRAQEDAKYIAKRIGHWVMEEDSEQEIDDKVALMILLAEKMSVSYMEVWPDAEKQKLNSEVYDAFEICLLGNKKEIYDSPFLIKIVPKEISDLKANPQFDQEVLDGITPDNKYASSEVKNAYLVSKFGGTNTSDASATLLLREAYIPEHLDEHNMEAIARQSDSKQILDGKKKGDIVMRQVFTLRGTSKPLLDQYVNLSRYPFVDYRLEPGPIYQTAKIERLIPMNKSFDAIMSRVEKYIHTMVAGKYLRKKGEPTTSVTNESGEFIDYEVNPPTQMQIASIPSFLFQFLGLLQGLMDSQGVTTATLGKLPKGVRGYQAIESLKQTDYANLKIPVNQLIKTRKRIAETMIDYASQYFITPQAVYRLEKGEPDYFDVVGNAGVQARKNAKAKDFPDDMIKIQRDHRVRIEIVGGQSFTEQGRRDAMKEMIGFMETMIKGGYLPKDAMMVIARQMLESFKFGGISDIMNSIATAKEGEKKFEEDDIKKIKMAFLQVIMDMKKAQEGGVPGMEEQPTQGGPAPAPNPNIQPAPMPGEGV